MREAKQRKVAQKRRRWWTKKTRSRPPARSARKKNREVALHVHPRNFDLCLKPNTTTKTTKHQNGKATQSGEGTKPPSCQDTHLENGLAGGQPCSPRQVEQNISTHGT
ncbi:unnamed protein product [Ectocarpus sp. 6 AP-2014]